MTENPKTGRSLAMIYATNHNRRLDTTPTPKPKKLTVETIWLFSLIWLLLNPLLTSVRLHHSLQFPAIDITSNHAIEKLVTYEH